MPGIFETAAVTAIAGWFVFRLEYIRTRLDKINDRLTDVEGHLEYRHSFEPGEDD